MPHVLFNFLYLDVTLPQVYLVDIKGNKPRELTSGKQGATHNPVFNTQGDKVAWLELDKDGYESDRFDNYISSIFVRYIQHYRAKIVIYDVEKDVRFTLTQKWDRSPDGLAVSPADTCCIFCSETVTQFSKGNGEFLYFTAGDQAKIKVFVVPLPPTPDHSTTDPVLPPKYTTPVTLTHTHAASGIQTLPNGRLIFMQSSFTSPNDVFIFRGLESLEDMIETQCSVAFEGQAEQVTRFTEESLKGKHLSSGEEFWFKGAESRNVQGWILKPKGWRSGERKQWPIILLIHGGGFVKRPQAIFVILIGKSGPQGAWEDQWSNRWNPNSDSL
jgi:hypothetical protein